MSMGAGEPLHESIKGVVIVLPVFCFIIELPSHSTNNKQI